MNNIVIDALEIDPVKLLFKTNLSRADFAEVLGVEKNTLDRWCAGIKKPGKQSRRLAAELAHKWGVEL